MPPQLALVLCIVCVLFLLRHERRRSAAHVSDASWIPTLWMLAIASKPLGIWFGSAGDAESGSELDRLVLAALGLAAVAVLVRRRFEWQGALRQHWWLLALLAYMLASTSWSDITSIAVRRWLRDAIVLIMALVIMSEPHPRQALESIVRRSAYILLPFSLLLIKYYPSLGREYGRWSGGLMWIGVTLHKNSLGRLCVVASFFLMWALYRRWKEGTPAGSRHSASADASVLLLGLFLLKGSDDSYSATSIATFASGIAAFGGLLWLRKSRLLVPQLGLAALVTVLVAFGVSAPILGGSNLVGVSSTMGRDETLTGRTQTWAELMPMVEKRPLLGYGFGSFWTTERRNFYRMSHGHNGYLDILLDQGAVGLALYTAWLLSCARALHRAFAADREWSILAICFLLMTLVSNITESALNSLSEHMTALVVLVSMVVPYGTVRSSCRPHFGLRVHVPQKRHVGGAPPQSFPSENRRAVRILHRGCGQRRQRVRTRHGAPPSAGPAG
jgi:exopolysaccharide production protein ExoQ